MENIILILLLLSVLAIAVLRVHKHFSGGGCCGSASETIRTRKTLTEPIVCQKRLRIDGMHCKNCQARVENAVNRLDGAACEVDLHKGIATVDCAREIPDEQLRQAVEKLGYTVVEIL